MAAILEEYTSRIRWPLTVYEIESAHRDPQQAQRDEASQINARIREEAFVIALDERGNGLKSLDFAKTLENLQNNGMETIQFLIGGADGLTDSVRDRASMLLSFGQQTWPHMLARIMLLEQIYRAQQILQGHPYHRE